MYREPDYSQLERELDSLCRNEINELERDLSGLYCNPRLNQLQNKDSILELEQRLSVVRKRKKYLDNIFKTDDEIYELEHEIRTDKFFTRVATLVTGPLFGGIGLLYLMHLESNESYFALGVGAMGTLLSIIAGRFAYKDKKKAAAKLRGLNESPEYKALTESFEYKALLNKEFVKALPSRRQP